MRRVLGPYLLAQLPGWVLAGLASWGLQHSGVLTTGVAAALLFVWIGKDVLLFPVMRRFYESEPVGRHMVGEHGTTVTALAPDGLVRVRGELWRARSEAGIPQGARICVREIHGLTLVVSALTPDREPRSS